MIHQEALAELEERLEVTFSDRNLLIQALTHRSYLNEHPEHPTGHYERLEFLGDAVLELLVTEHLYRHYPELPEGDLTEKRAALVETANLVEVAKEIGISADILFLSKGERKNVQTSEKSFRYMMACCVEALLGAIYLEHGFGDCRLFADVFILRRMTRVFETRRDYKSELQEYAQATFNATPHYEVIDVTGPDHERHFHMACVMNGRQIGLGAGSSKKEAQFAAAQSAFEALKESGTKAEAAKSDDERPQAPILARETAERSEPEVIVRRQRQHQSTEEAERPSGSPAATPVAPACAETENEGEMEHKDQAFVEYVVRAMVNHPEDVRTERTVDERGVLITLYIHHDDMRYIVGREGQNAHALRILLKTVGSRENARVNLKIFEPEDLRHEHQVRKGSSPSAHRINAEG